MNNETPSTSKVLIIGWDGATFDLMRPWVEEGKLPNVARLMKEGAHGPLRSTVPPMTYPAWTSFMTGGGPGRHGIYDFTKRLPGSYELQFVNGGQRKASTFWRLLSEAGRRVISISIPCTFPPEPVNGDLICGFDAAGACGAVATVDSRAMHPPELHDELQKNVGGHPIGAFIANDINSGRPEAGLEKMLDTVRRKAATAKYLMQNRDWDCSMILFGESDGAGHQFWKYCDPDSPLFEDRPGMRDSILRVYQELDRQTGELIDLAPPDTTVLMMSDHGFGGVSDWVLYPNCFLNEKKFLSFRSRFSRSLSRRLESLKLHAISKMPRAMKHALLSLAGSRIGAIESRIRFAMIDWDNTRAYFEENPYYPSLWVNLEDRQPQGTVSPGEEYEQVRDELIAELESWRHPESGEPVVEWARRREEVYSGQALEEAPDVIVKWGLLKGYNYAFRLSSKSRDLAWTEQMDPHKEENLAFFSGKTGHHRDDGIFLAGGPLVRPGAEIDGARIIDLAPTILHLCGVGVPDSMDGRVLEDVLQEDFMQQRRVEHTNEDTVAAAVDSSYSTEDDEAIAERLRALGYID